MAKAQREFTRPAPTPEPAPVADDGLFGDELTAESPAPPEPDPPQAEATAEPQSIAPPADSGEMPRAPDGFKPLTDEPFPGRYGAPPYDHAPVQLTPDGERFMVAQWQVSRRWSGARPGNPPGWEPYGFWAIRATGGRPITFKPVGWREHRD